MCVCVGGGGGEKGDIFHVPFNLQQNNYNKEPRSYPGIESHKLCHAFILLLLTAFRVFQNDKVFLPNVDCRVNLRLKQF